MKKSLLRRLAFAPGFVLALGLVLAARPAAADGLVDIVKAGVLKVGIFEEFLYRHPKIQDVQVIGIPDPRYGEELCAWVRLRDGESATVEEIRGFCQGQIAHYKVPRYVKFVDGFPMTVTGKIQKYIMRQQMIAELQLTVEKTA